MLALLLLLSLPASLDGDATLQEGMKLYEALEYERAAIRFHEAAQVPDRPPADRAVVQVWLGVVYANLGELDRARIHLERAVRDDVDVVGPAILPPSVREALEVARARERERRAQAIEAARPPPVDPEAAVALQPASPAPASPAPASPAPASPAPASPTAGGVALPPAQAATASPPAPRLGPSAAAGADLAAAVAPAPGRADLLITGATAGLAALACGAAPAVAAAFSCGLGGLVCVAPASILCAATGGAVAGTALSGTTLPWFLQAVPVGVGVALGVATAGVAVTVAAVAPGLLKDQDDKLVVGASSVAVLGVGAVLIASGVAISLGIVEVVVDDPARAPPRAPEAPPPAPRAAQAAAW